MKKLVEVCNICEDISREVDYYTIAGKGKRQRVALCVEHGAYLDRLLGGRGETPKKRRSYSGKLVVTTLEQIEAGKGKTPQP